MFTPRRKVVALDPDAQMGSFILGASHAIAAYQLERFAPLDFDVLDFDVLNDNGAGDFGNRTPCFPSTGTAQRA